MPPVDAVGPRLRPPIEQRLGGDSASSVDIDELLELFSAHHPDSRVDRIERAYQLALVAHDGAVRRSGDPYISHPIEVAEIVADLGLDEASVIAALLHDVVEDTDISLDDITAEYSNDPPFAAVVRLLVDGLTKLDGLRFETAELGRAADLRRMLAAIAKDPRVLVIKLADRLHNMRTISALPEHKRSRIATETLEVYAPLAHRIGMGRLRTELEDLAFATLHPERFAVVSRRIAERRAGLSDEITEVTETLHGALDDAGVNARVSWRLKHAWGVDVKMRRTAKSFDEILDVVGVRVVVATIADCYAAVGLIHALWQPVPTTFKDYVASPKFNLYQSLHTTVFGPSGRTVEVQIRTEEMHDLAEYGVAAHWAYKESVAPGGDDFGWMRRLLESDAEGSSYVDDVTGELARREILCVTPSGRALTLPEGATPIDFAYMIHSEVGNRAVAAKVNGSIAGLDHQLADGDQVEIVVSNDEARGPNSRWLSWVVTPRARQQIRRWHTRARITEAADSGRIKVLAAYDARMTRLDAPPITDIDEALRSVQDRWGYTDVTTFAAAVGAGRISGEAVAARLLPTPPPREPRRRSVVPDEVLVEGAPGIEVTFAGCCSPELGDRLIGWVTVGRGVSVHRATCTNAAGLVARDGARVVAVEWAASEPAAVTAAVEVSAFNRSGLFADTAVAIADAGAEIRKVDGATDDLGLARQTYRIAAGGTTAIDAAVDALFAVDGVIDVDVALD